ncbi:hypothetical protein F5J12DRAFT_784054 [Pisolithus orientalis]|uniref:uncharacterized protein n=1 Tax=Pisolithus orientalis TaxID=936130 RepID=UPI0022243D3B|nr:uncharacterized protein F5J12DRAFT_784054 [Pisolithus orientalis]KAI6002335.1 hypothetical protein F5J12DRAFT_784054 [Pisolithus orientalis]
MPPNPIPQSPTAVATPVFHQHPTDSHHFGFSVLAQQPGHIMPPGMEPDLQVLNNPYTTTIWGDQLPATIPDSCINPSLDSLLSSRQTLATTDVRHKSSEKLSSEGSSEEESESSSNNPLDTEAGKVSGDESDKDEDNAFGWGAMNLRQSTHPVWKDCLKDAKQECRAAHALSNPFPSKSHDFNLSITEVLVTVIVEWNQHSVQFEDGYWPDHKQDMLLGDISTWHSELKSVTLATMPSTFNLIPPSDVAPWVCVQWIETTATKLLDNSLFLQDSFDENGKTRNFTHPALKEAVIQFYYTRTYQIVDQHPESFNNSVPLSCLALVTAVYHCVLDRFAKNGTGKMMPQFSGKAYISIFHGMMKVLNNILHNPYHGVRLHDQLSQWVKEGWAALQEVDLNVESMQLMPMLLFLSYLL